MEILSTMGTLAVSGSLERAMRSQYPERAAWNARPRGGGYPHDLAFDQNGAAYLVPIADVPDRGACLRVKPTKNNQAKGVRW
jgi:hypothetical protein